MSSEDIVYLLQMRNRHRAVDQMLVHLLSVCLYVTEASVCAKK